MKEKVVQKLYQKGCTNIISHKRAVLTILSFQHSSKHSLSYWFKSI